MCPVCGGQSLVYMSSSFSLLLLWSITSYWVLSLTELYKPISHGAWKPPLQTSPVLRAEAHTTVFSILRGAEDSGSCPHTCIAIITPLTELSLKPHDRNFDGRVNTGHRCLNSLPCGFHGDFSLTCSSTLQLDFTFFLWVLVCLSYSSFSTEEGIQGSETWHGIAFYVWGKLECYRPWWHCWSQGQRN